MITDFQRFVAFVLKKEIKKEKRIGTVHFETTGAVTLLYLVG